MYQKQRTLKGWTAASVISLTLSLVVLVVERHETRRRQTGRSVNLPVIIDPQPALDTSGADCWELMCRNAVRLSRSVADQPARRRPAKDSFACRLLSRPPQPPANIVLRPPTSGGLQPVLFEDQLKENLRSLLPLLEQALAGSPQALTVSSHSAGPRNVAPVRVAHRPILPDPATDEPRIPVPKRLLQSIKEFREQIAATQQTSHLTSSDAPPVISIGHYQLQQWIAAVSRLVDRLVFDLGLQHRDTLETLASLRREIERVEELKRLQRDSDVLHELDALVGALQRHYAVWRSIADGADTASVGLTPVRNVQTRRHELRTVVQRVRSELGDGPEGLAWQRYLMLDELERWSEAGSSDESIPLATMVLTRFTDANLSPDQRRFLSSPTLASLQSQLLALGADSINLRQLLDDIESVELDSISRARFNIAQQLQILRLSHQEAHRNLAKEIDRYYRDANLRLQLSENFLSRFVPQEDYEVRPVRRNILGADTRGRSVVRTHLALKLIPDPVAWNIELSVRGKVDSDTRSVKGPAEFFNTSEAKVEAKRYIRITDAGYQVLTKPTQVHSREHFRGLRTSLDGVPLIGNLARIIAQEQFDQQRSVARRLTQRLIARETDVALDQELEGALQKIEDDFRNKVLGPLNRLQIQPVVQQMHTTTDHVIANYLLADEAQLAACTAAPLPPEDAWVYVQLHESAINNAIDQLGLGTREWSVPELYEHLGHTLSGRQWQVPDDVPQDLRVQFAPTRPITVEFQDNHVQLTLRIARLYQPNRLNIGPFIVKSNYVPESQGLAAELVRDGIVEIISRRDRLALRLIFAKIFVARPEIALIQPQWRDDPRAEGLEVGELQLRNGWFTLAISPVQSQRNVEVIAQGSSETIQQ